MYKKNCNLSDGRVKRRSITCSRHVFFEMGFVSLSFLPPCDTSNHPSLAFFVSSVISSAIPHTRCTGCLRLKATSLVNSVFSRFFRVVWTRKFAHRMFYGPPRNLRNITCAVCRYFEIPRHSSLSQHKIRYRGWLWPLAPLGREGQDVDLSGLTSHNRAFNLLS